MQCENELTGSLNGPLRTVLGQTSPLACERMGRSGWGGEGGAKAVKYQSTKKVIGSSLPLPDQDRPHGQSWHVW